MSLTRLIAAGVFAALLGCATHEYTEHERREDWRREAYGRPPPCPGAFWENGEEYPDGRWDPGRWRCPEHARYEDRR